MAGSNTDRRSSSSWRSISYCLAPGKVCRFYLQKPNDELWKSSQGYALIWQAGLGSQINACSHCPTLLQSNPVCLYALLPESQGRMIRITDNGVSYILQGILLADLVPGFFHYRQFIFMNGYCSNWYYLGKQLLETLLHGIAPSSTNVLFHTHYVCRWFAGGTNREL